MFELWLWLHFFPWLIFSYQPRSHRPILHFGAQKWIGEGFVESSKKQESSRKISTTVLLTMSKPLTVDHHKLWKILKGMGIPDHLTCLLRNLYAGQEATVRTRHGTTDWFQIGKGVHQGCILSSGLFNLYLEYIMRNNGLDEAQAGIKIAGREINNLICRWHHPYGRKWRRTKEPLDGSERGEWKKVA